MCRRGLTARRAMDEHLTSTDMPRPPGALMYAAPSCCISQAASLRIRPTPLLRLEQSLPVQDKECMNLSCRADGHKVLEPRSEQESCAH